MRIFVAGLATEVNTFSPIFIGMDGFRDSLLARPGEHPETPTLCPGAAGPIDADNLAGCSIRTLFRRSKWLEGYEQHGLLEAQLFDSLAYERRCRRTGDDG